MLKSKKEQQLEDLYKILGQDIAYILNAGKCQIAGIKESVLLKMNNKEFEPGTQDINNITLPIKYRNSHCLAPTLSCPPFFSSAHSLI